MKKINIGIVLIIITIILFIIFVIVDSNIKKEDMEKAFKFITDYIDFKQKYVLLPEEYRDMEKLMPEEEYEKYLEEVKEKLSKYVLDTQLDYEFKFYKDMLDKQYKGGIEYKEYQINNLDFTQYSDSSGNMDNINNIVGDNFIIKVRYELRIVGRKRKILTTIDADTSRYVGTIEEMGNISNFTGIPIVLKKMRDGKFKVVLDTAFGT